MDWFVQYAFLTEIVEQCEYALYAYEQMVDELNHDRIRYYHLQSFLVSGACVSKLLWPTKVGKQMRPQGMSQTAWEIEIKQRGRDLVALLGIRSDNPLTALVDFRNRFEHFDEDIQGWAHGPGQFALQDRTPVAPAPVDSSQQLPHESRWRRLTMNPPTLHLYGPLHHKAATLPHGTELALEPIRGALELIQLNAWEIAFDGGKTAWAPDFLSAPWNIWAGPGLKQRVSGARIYDKMPKEQRKPKPPSRMVTLPRKRVEAQPKEPAKT